MRDEREALIADIICKAEGCDDAGPTQCEYCSTGVTASCLGVARTIVAALTADGGGGEAYWLRKHAAIVRELGNSMSPGALASTMERRAEGLVAGGDGERGKP
jgi:hypothetical protein